MQNVKRKTPSDQGHTNSYCIFRMRRRAQAHENAMCGLLHLAFCILHWYHLPKIAIAGAVVAVPTRIGAAAAGVAALLLALGFA